MRYIKKVQSENTQTVIEYKGRPMRGSFYTKMDISLMKEHYL